MRGARTSRLVGTFVRARAYRDWRWIGHWLRSTRGSRTALGDRLPWLPYGVIDQVARHVRSDMTVFEYGSGGSTLWLVERVALVVSVEHQHDWTARVRRAIEAAGAGGRSVIREVPPEGGPEATIAGTGITYGSALEPGNYERYVRVIDSYPDDAFDLVLVDGRSRAACLIHALRKVAPGGMLVLDDSDRDRYAEAMRHLHGWARKDVLGLRPYSDFPGHSTVWTRPTRDDATPDGGP